MASFLFRTQFFGFLNAMFWLFRKASLLYKTSKIVFSRFILKIYDMGIHGVTRGDTGLQEVTVGYKGFQGVTGGHKGLQGLTGGDTGLRGLQRIIETFF